MKKTNHWKNSKAKMLLKEDILNKIVTDAMKAKDIYTMREEYKAFPYKNFWINLGNLQKLIKTKQSHAYLDIAAFVNDCCVWQSATGSPQMSVYPQWDGSEAGWLLKLHIKNGKRMLMKPKDLQKMQDAYKLFPLEVFCKHIHQELQSGRTSSYWMNKKQKWDLVISLHELSTDLKTYTTK